MIWGNKCEAFYKNIYDKQNGESFLKNWKENEGGVLKILKEMWEVFLELNEK
ncbi:hypothetical protein MmiHf6_09220 [Methanimicrococcus hongohii]|uniref:Uncharacterized protein n=1 Tax=Methanimicrococcus hongohii TaxID=3028295 RepID=A0AA96V213_9EURY|nr:hypothetical protein MmiHf6_09220 [Methanimicrococcus sp. Hf6]